MIKKPTVIQPKAQPTRNLQPILIPIKPKETKKSLTFQQVLENIKNFDKLDEEHLIDDMVEQLTLMAERKELIQYLIKETRNSRFTAYNMAMRNFHSAMSRYAEGLYKKSDLETYRDNLVDDHSDSNYHDFYKFRVYLINSIINEKVEDLAQCTFILCYGTHGKDEDDAYNNYKNQVKSQVINLSQLVWPNETKALTVMLGETNVKR